MYFCISKARKLSAAAGCELLRPYLYSCTSKASNLGTVAGEAILDMYDPGRVRLEAALAELVSTLNPKP